MSEAPLFLVLGEQRERPELEGEESMAKVRRHRHHSGGSDRDHSDHDRSGGDGPYNPSDDPEEERLAHLEIEKRRFSGGLPATPELYALAGEQWHRLPGSLVRPSTGPIVGKPSKGH
jgi:hypothetical protein